ncbi:hypothetical protein EMCG_02636 [[Emmonsia] crescens]|uniref:Aminoglycoside phosphotransferase domain-containing protein n=1 Tax=[Emmonsia] crescens TaxID=73230 RepID=A0A0G2HY39_9EURO|nr:hypothetical protein EMCG_02636 [Emmonsia crescens UAMH 3008]
MSLFPKFPNLQKACRISRPFLSTTPSALSSTGHRSYHAEASMPTLPADKDWNSRDDFFSFTRGRFVVDEADQIARRYIKFNMNELARIAAESVGAKVCVTVEKCPDGMYNKNFVLTMDDGQEIIAKVPNPNAGIPCLTTASEVATMDFVRNVLGTPAPKVYSWDSRATNSVGAEYIIMEKVPGVQLRQVWDNMKLVDKMNLRLDMARHQSAWLSVSFSQFGGLYYTQDLAHVPRENHLYRNTKGDKIWDERFAIGPVTGRDWFDCGRVRLDCDRGPWPSVYNYYKAIGLREKLAISTLTPLPKQTVMVCGPGLYQPERRKKLSAVEEYLQVLDALLPTESETITTPYLWHDDLHDENIFVDPNNPSKVVGIIDWQSVNLLPLLDHNPDPAFIGYRGPEPETLDRPELEDTKGLSEIEKAEAISQYHEKALFIASRKIALKRTPAAYDAIKYRQTEAFDLLVLGRRLLEFGEAHFHALMVGLRDAWSKLPANKGSKLPRPFPIMLDNERLAEIEEDGEKAMRGMQIMNSFKARLGPLWPDKDAVEHEQYEAAKVALRELKEEIVQDFGKTEKDKTELARQWPFDD